MRVGKTEAAKEKSSMTGFEQCAFDLAKDSLQIVKDTVGVHKPDQLAAVHDMVIFICQKTKGMTIDVDVDAVIRRAIEAVFTPKA
jgi:hypothetical protein